MALVVIGQIQFLATLSLVDSTGAEDSWILDFVGNLRSENARFTLSYAKKMQDGQAVGMETSKADSQALTLP